MVDNSFVREMPKLRKNLGLAVDERRQDERGDNETDQLHDEKHWHRLACDARERLAETALVAEATTWGFVAPQQSQDLKPLTLSADRSIAKALPCWRSRQESNLGPAV